MGKLPHPSLYWTADRSELVEEGDLRAAFLAYGPFDDVEPEHKRMLTEVAHDVPDPGPEAKPAPKPATKPRITKRA